MPTIATNHNYGHHLHLLGAAMLPKKVHTTGDGKCTETLLLHWTQGLHVHLCEMQLNFCGVFAGKA